MHRPDTPQRPPRPPDRPRERRAGREAASRRVAVVLAAVLVAASAPLRAQAPGSGSAAIPAALAGVEKRLGNAARTHGALRALQQLYAANAVTALWSRGGEITPQARALLRELWDADAYGLQVEDYAPEELEAPLGVAAATDARLARFDVELTATALRFISDLHFGRVSPAAAGFHLPEPREPFDLAQALRSVASAPNIGGALTGIEPAFYHYTLLKEALAGYRRMARESDPQPLPPIRAALKVGDAYGGAAALRRRLVLLQDLPAADAPQGADAVFDAHLSEGVRHFQQRHGLSADGVLGKSTLAALNVPLAQRIRQIVLTLERWRWLPPFKTPPIIVNIPQFRLFAFRTTEDRVSDILQMDVIVGRTFARTQTPVFESDMRYLVVRPYWDVPQSIMRNEMLAKIRANPEFLAREHLELVDGPADSSPVVPPTAASIEALAAGRLRLRQLPGEDNALGLVKFIFPNSHNVYLHATPANQLFKDSFRAFSHGCIRVADPVALAALVLKDAPGDWTREKIVAAMNGEATLRVDLSRPINVLILYATALATEAGPVLFFGDLYGYDRKLERQLGLAPVR